MYGPCITPAIPLYRADHGNTYEKPVHSSMTEVRRVTTDGMFGLARAPLTSVVGMLGMPHDRIPSREKYMCQR